MDIQTFTNLSNMESYSNLTMNKELFVVQRCWHSGTKAYQPLDYLRLFLTQRDAEEAAYHSAHAWCRYHAPQDEPQVKTLLLPSYPANSNTGSSYGFIAHGSLFWVRSLMATVTGNHHEGYAVVTEGVIGGTGNRNSRRGTEIPVGRVFVGANSRMKALQVCHQVMQQVGIHVSTNIATMPIGKKSDQYTNGEFLKDWPPQVLQPNLVTPSANNEHKRDNYYFEVEDEGMLVDCPFELPPNKRRRFCNALPITVVDDEMMMSYGVAGEQA